MLNDSFEIVSCDERGYMIKCRFHNKIIWVAFTKKGFGRGGEQHPITQYSLIINGKVMIKMMFHTQEIEKVYINQDLIIIPEKIPHVMIALEDTLSIEWHDGELPPFKDKVLYEPYRKLVRGQKMKDEENPFKLIVICSVTVPECFDRLLKKSLEIIGVPYKLILTDPNLSLSESYNSILKTNMDDIKHSKYLLFIAQDVPIQDVNWGQKLVAVCDSLPDFGYGSIECRRGKEQIGYYHANKADEPPVEVMTCDGAFAIIPSKIFLEHQFDESFPWYPVMEDYQCWVRLVKHLKVYHVPVKGYATCATYGCPIPSKWVSQFANNTEYVNRLAEDHKRLLKKWNLDELITTTFG